MHIKRIVNVYNDEKIRDYLVLKFFNLAYSESNQNIKTVLDIGSGTQKYKNLIENFGLKYLSHDFARYKGLATGDVQLGFREKFWPPATTYDIVCDILELQTNFCDFVILTEVLEHVPDPVVALKKAVDTLGSKGYLIVSVPSHSFVHQAPFYFSAGLSPYWFEYHCEKMQLNIVDSAFIGDYLDFINLHAYLYLPGFMIFILRRMALIRNRFIRRTRRSIKLFS